MGVKLTIQRPDDKKILKAILKSAYLICFINWGYDFAFSSNGNLIRDVFKDEKEYPIKFTSFWFDKSNLPQDIKLPLGLCRIENPTEMKIFVVNVPLELNSYSSIVSIMIPFAGESGLKRLEEINDLQKTEPTVDITFKQEAASLPNNILDGYSRTSDFF